MTKRWLEEEQARGFTSGNKNLICAKHLSDTSLNNYITKNGKHNACDYCDTDGNEEAKVITFDELMEVIFQGITNHYSTPDNEGLPFVSSEGGYFMHTTFDTYDLIRDIIMLEADDDGIIQEIIDSIGNDKTWCHYSPDFPSESVELSFDWNFFSNLLKHKVRYVFFQHPKKYKNHYRPIIPSSILEKIGDFVVGLNLFYNTETDGGLFDKLEIFRARQHARKDSVESCKDIGPLSPSKSKSSNRFSPAGIPMFYGSRKEEVAIEEVINRKMRTENISTGCFENVKPLNLVDLTKIPEISIFDLDRSHFYEAAIFLKTFAKNISKKIIRDGREHFEYVPTQVVTEYIRHVVPIKFGSLIDGLVYKSSVAKDEDCFVIFADGRHCRDKGSETKHTILSLKKDSLKKVKVRDVKRRRMRSN